MNQKIMIRAADPGDAAHLRELRLEALNTQPEAFAADYYRTMAESVQDWSERIDGFARNKNGVICVGASENSLTGMAGIVKGNRPKTQHGGSIWGVYVKKEWRGLGVAKALLNECIAWAKAQGLVIVKLGVVTTNTPAIGCYSRCGFKVYGIEPQVIYYEGVFYDELLMAKSII